MHFEVCYGTMHSSSAAGNLEKLAHVTYSRPEAVEEKLPIEYEAHLTKKSLYIGVGAPRSTAGCLPCLGFPLAA